MLERDTVKKIVVWCKSQGFYTIKFHGSPFSAIGQPDLIICAKGKFIAIEVKRKGREPTKAQIEKIRSINEAGGYAGWCNDADKAISWLSDITKTELP